MTVSLVGIVGYGIMVFLCAVVSAYWEVKIRRIKRTLKGDYDRL